MNKFFSSVISVIVFLISYALFKYMGLVGLLFLVAYYIGDWLGKLVAKKTNPVKIGLIPWVNLFSWLLPPLGVLTASFSYALTTVPSGDSNKYRTLAIIGGILSAINAGLGILVRL